MSLLDDGFITVSNKGQKRTMVYAGRNCIKK